MWERTISGLLPIRGGRLLPRSTGLRPAARLTLVNCAIDHGFPTPFAGVGARCNASRVLKRSPVGIAVALRSIFCRASSRLEESLPRNSSPSPILPWLMRFPKITFTNFARVLKICCCWGVFWLRHGGGGTFLVWTPKNSGWNPSGVWGAASGVGDARIEGRACGGRLSDFSCRVAQSSRRRTPDARLFWPGPQKSPFPLSAPKKPKNCTEIGHRRKDEGGRMKDEPDETNDRCWTLVRRCAMIRRLVSWDLRTCCGGFEALGVGDCFRHRVY
jgi:hypothetical protein